MYTLIHHPPCFNSDPLFSLPLSHTHNSFSPLIFPSPQGRATNPALGDPSALTHLFQQHCDSLVDTLAQPYVLLLRQHLEPLITQHMGGGIAGAHAQEEQREEGEFESNAAAAGSVQDGGGYEGESMLTSFAVVEAVLGEDPRFLATPHSAR